MVKIAKKLGFNKYKIDSDIIIIYLEKRDGTVFETYTDRNQLNKLLTLNYRWSACWHKKINGYYAQASVYTGEAGKNKTFYLHKIVTNAKAKDYVNHKNHNTLDNRLCNLELTTNAINCSDRQKANKNNKSTGIRNVSFFKKENIYKVQICKDYKRYIWEFPIDQFEEACKFAKEKRIEIFGRK